MEAFGTLAPVVRSPLCLLVDKSLAIKCQTDPIIHLGDTLFSSEKSPPLFLLTKPVKCFQSRSVPISSHNLKKNSSTQKEKERKRKNKKKDPDIEDIGTR